MRKLALVSLISLLPSAFAADLTLPGERWIAKFDKYVCAAFGPAVSRPSALEEMKVTFEQVTTDMTLDNGLLKATFEENGKNCRYNAIILADNDAATVQLIQSIAYSTPETATSYRECLAGKAVLDEALTSSDYLYYGHPHNLAIMLPNVGADSVCGADAKVIGANFVVTGRLPGAITR